MAGPPLVQSLVRAFDLLELMADSGGDAGLSELSDASGIPLGTIHRLMRTLVQRGYARQERSRRYALGPRLIRLGETASRLLGLWARPYLTQLVDLTGETANLALREGDEVVYVAQVPSKHSMRMFTEVGRRVPLHTSGVGKAILAQLPSEEVDAILSRSDLPALTDRTITQAGVLHEQLEIVRDKGYAADVGEYEVGVSCVAVPLPGAFALAALSVSGPAARLTPETRQHVAPLMQRVARELSKALEDEDAD
ncbi:allantoin degradation transcriptional regulator AllR [soil metagenome]